MLFLWLVNFPFHFWNFFGISVYNPRKKIEEMMTANYSNCLDSLGTPSLFFPTTPPLTLASFHAVLNWVDSRAYLSLSCWVCSPFRAIGDNNDETHKVCAPIVERDHFERSVCYFL
jgi:hypothetical protein